jgi:hypothetical protein
MIAGCFHEPGQNGPSNSCVLTCRRDGRERSQSNEDETGVQESELIDRQ